MSIHIHIDDRPLEVNPGLTILQAARQHDIYIPTLCDYPGLPPHGSCRMCVVEIQGKANTPTACTTPVEEGMVIQTNSPKVQSLRAELLQMLLADHPSSCLFCPEKSHCDECMVTLRKAGVTTGCRSCAKDGQCDLQLLVDQIGLSEASYPSRYRMLPVEKSDPFFDLDYNLCILCSRCIRTCEELHFINALAYTQRGSDTVVGTAFNRTHLEASCAFCGACVEVCPTGAISEKTRKWDGAPEAETPSTCPLCSLGCQIRLVSKNGMVIGSLPDRAAGSDVLCVKGRFGITELVNHPSRLVNPHKTAGLHQLEISWEEALDLSVKKLCNCAPGHFQMVASANNSNEDLFIAQKFSREVMKSGPVQVPALAHYRQSLPVIRNLLQNAGSLDRLDQAVTILALGLDVKYAQSVVEVHLKHAQNRGARLVVIDAIERELNPFADLWLQPVSGKEADLIQTITACLQDPASGEYDSSLEQAAQWMAQPGEKAILFGTAWLAHLDQAALLQSIARLAEFSDASVVLLPEEGNLIGALLLGAVPLDDAVLHREDAVVYVIGEDLPSSLPDSATVLYQNLYLPEDASRANLLLPAAAFSEVEGSSVTSAGLLRETHPAVNPPGGALPSWQILCRLAQKMGYPGFDYASAAEMRAEIAQAIKTGMDMPLPVTQPAFQDANNNPGRTLSSPGRHLYMGFPLSRRVEGFAVLPVGEDQRQGSSHG